MKNPCRNCEHCYVYKNRHIPNYDENCRNCEKYIAYRKSLKSKRQFEAGEPIYTLDELLKQDFVIWHDMTRHIEFIKSSQLRLVLSWLDKGIIRKAIRRKKQ